MTDGNSGASSDRRDARGRFAKGNAGKPKGARHKATQACERAIKGKATQITEAVVEQALAGDMQAARLCMERVLPPMKDRPINIDLPDVESASDMPRAIASILAAATDGTIGPSDAKTLAAVVGDAGKAIELAELEQRISDLESKT